jgi:prepilin-type processing-associated H-X9-DG protein
MAFDDPTYPGAGGTWTKANEMINSKHGSGANVAFCDGHLQFLRDDIDVNPETGGTAGSGRTLYQALCTPNGGEIIDDAIYQR